MVTISCSGKFHAFALAEQMERFNALDRFYTTYAYQKNDLLAKIVKRVDKEQIPSDRISTNTLLAFPMKLFPGAAYRWNDLFDRWVAQKLRGSSGKLFIGWSGMSLHALRVARDNNMLTILERGSSHIQYQDEVLREEYSRYGKTFSVDHRVIAKELEEYSLADYIAVPSNFVRNSFIEKGVSESKLILNPYGASKSFQASEVRTDRKNSKFTIVYLGSLTIRKGLRYLFEAIDLLDIPHSDYEVWFIGSVSAEVQPLVEKYKKENWVFFGHINHYELRDHLEKCHVGIQPSVEEGLSMVIPQMMASGVTMIVTPNSGGENIINDGVNGLVVPIRTPAAIASGIKRLYTNRTLLKQMGENAAASIKEGFTWNDYGDRYWANIKKVLHG